MISQTLLKTLTYFALLTASIVGAQPSATPSARQCPADPVLIGGQNILEIIGQLGAEREAGCSDEELAAYVKHFDRVDRDGDERHSKEEYIEQAGYMTPMARRGIFGAADNDADGYVSRSEYILNRIITDEAKAILQAYDSDKSRSISKAEFVDGCPLEDKKLAAAVFDALDTTGDGSINVPEYLRVWGHWARPNYKEQEAALSDRMEGPSETANLSELWSYGLISRRTGEPLITEDGEHRIDPANVSYGYNIVVDKDGRTIRPGGLPLQGGEQLVRTETYQEDHNVREYARVVSIMAPIRDAILYNFENTSREEWLALTEVLRLNNIKNKAADSLSPRSILSAEQVYDYAGSKPTEGSPVARFLDEAELELKCLAFLDFDFTNPQGGNHAKEHGIEVGSGIKLH